MEAYYGNYTFWAFGPWPKCSVGYTHGVMTVACIVLSHYLTMITKYFLLY